MNFGCRWLGLAVLWIGLPAAADEPAATLFWIAQPWPAGSKAGANLQAAARGIAKATAGRVQVKFAEQPDLETPARTCDGGLLAGPRLALRSPAARIYLLPLLINTPAAAERAQRTLDSAIRGELADQGLETVAWVDLGFAYLLSRPLIDTVARFQASRLWVPPVEAETLRAAESFGTPLVPLEAANVRDALQNGRVDAVIAPPLGAILMQWHVAVSNVVDVPLLALRGAVVLRRESLARLAEPDRQLLRDGLGRAFADAAAELRGQEAESLAVLEKNGVARRPLGSVPEEQAAWQAWAAGVADRLAAEGFVPAGLLAEVRRTLAGIPAAP